MTARTLLITGASGYIGGTILSAILGTEKPWRHEFEISALVRTEQQTTKLSQLGVKPVTFESFDETEKLRRIGEDFDVVIHAGAGWHAASARALIAGQGARSKSTGRGGHYLHISGTSNLSDRPHTQGYTETRTFSDEEDIYAYEKYRESFEVYPQRTTDITVVESGEEFGVSTYIVMAPTIFGLGTGPFNKYSIQLPAMITAALSSGRTIVLGDGQTVWSHIHIEDLAALFLSILENVSTGNAIPNGRNGIYFAETGMHTHLEFSQNLARAGYKLGLLQSPDVEAASLEEVGRQWSYGMPSRAELSFGAKYAIREITNRVAETDKDIHSARTKAIIGRKIGWRPTHGHESEGTFEVEVSAIKANPPAAREMPKLLQKKE